MKTAEEIKALLNHFSEAFHEYECRAIPSDHWDKLAEELEQRERETAIEFCMKRSKAPERYRKQYEQDFDEWQSNKQQL